MKLRFFIRQMNRQQSQPAAWGVCGSCGKLMVFTKEQAMAHYTYGGPPLKCHCDRDGCFLMDHSTQKEEDEKGYTPQQL